jgi:hypothetical protein
MLATTKTASDREAGIETVYQCNECGTWLRHSTLLILAQHHDAEEHAHIADRGFPLDSRIRDDDGRGQLRFPIRPCCTIGVMQPLELFRWRSRNALTGKVRVTRYVATEAEARERYGER